MIAFTILNIFDIIVTAPGITLFASGVEVNPLISWLLNINPDVVVVYKLVLNSLFIAVTVFAARRNFKLALSGAYIIFFAYSLFVIWNIVGCML